MIQTIYTHNGGMKENQKDFKKFIQKVYLEQNIYIRPLYEDIKEKLANLLAAIFICRNKKYT